MNPRAKDVSQTGTFFPPCHLSPDASFPGFSRRSAHIPMPFAEKIRHSSFLRYHSIVFSFYEVNLRVFATVDIFLFRFFSS